MAGYCLCGGIFMERVVPCALYVFVRVDGDSADMYLVLDLGVQRRGWGVVEEQALLLCWCE